MNHAQPAPTDFSHVSAAALLLPVSALACFHRMMQYQGWSVDLTRMCADADYAYQCLATAHTSSDERLRRAALSLFDAYARNGGAPALHWSRKAALRPGRRIADRPGWPAGQVV